MAKKSAANAVPAAESTSKIDVKAVDYQFDKLFAGSIYTMVRLVLFYCKMQLDFNLLNRLRVVKYSLKDNENFLLSSFFSKSTNRQNDIYFIMISTTSQYQNRTEMIIGNNHVFCNHNAIY